VFNKLAPGSAFFLPHGTKIYNKLIAMIRKEYHERGFQEVITPQLFHKDLWKQSGHLDKYAENIYMTHDG
jgi:threonyl-tRNA synthetase